MGESSIILKNYPPSSKKNFVKLFVRIVWKRIAQSFKKFETISNWPKKFNKLRMKNVSDLNLSIPKSSAILLQTLR